MKLYKNIGAIAFGVMGVASINRDLTAAAILFSLSMWLLFKGDNS